MIVVLVGPPGAGKGTHGRRIAARRGWPHVSSGDLLRDAVERETTLGLQAARYMKWGSLVPDSIMLSWVEELLDNPEYASGLVLDGFPRTVPQAEGFDDLLARHGLAVDVVLHFDIDEEAAIRRLGSRVSCSKCGAVYNMISNPPEDPEVCGRCGGRLEVREDDRVETIRARFDEFRRLTEPMLGYYRSNGKVSVISTDGPIESVGKRVTAALDALGDRPDSGSAAS
jgi:adenylate kinase